RSRRAPARAPTRRIVVEPAEPGRRPRSRRPPGVVLSSAVASPTARRPRRRAPGALESQTGTSVRANRSARSSRRTAAERGFTLIEIMVVVVIVGLRAAIVGPQLLGRGDAAAVNRAKSDIRAVETALQLYCLDNFRYP